MVLFRRSVLEILVLGVRADCPFVSSEASLSVYKEAKPLMKTPYAGAVLFGRDFLVNRLRVPQILGSQRIFLSVGLLRQINALPKCVAVFPDILFQARLCILISITSKGFPSIREIQVGFDRVQHHRFYGRLLSTLAISNRWFLHFHPCTECGE